jgi:hypothetical protein
MLRQFLPILLIVCLAGTAVSGCAWVGRTAGKTQAKIERKAHDLEDGYEKGYANEKSKTEPNQN